MKGPIIAAMKNMPVISDFEAKIFDITPESTKITHGPVDWQKAKKQRPA